MRPALFERLMLYAVFLLAVISLVATLPQTLALLQGVHPRSIDITNGLGLRLLREGWVLLLTFLLGAHLLLYRRSLGIGPSTFLTALVLLVYVVFTSIFTLLRDYPPIVVAAGIRAFQYVPIAFAGFLIARRLGTASLLSFARLLRLYVFVLLVLGVYQVLYSTPFSGETIFGARAYGTFPRANIYGMTMVTCALWLLLAGLAHQRNYGHQRFRFWLLLCAVGVVLSGSRTSMLLLALILMYPLFLRLRRGLDRTASLSALPLFVVLILLAVTNPALTGRNVDLSAEGRFRVWSSALQAIESPVDFVVGWGTGLATTTLNNLTEPGTFPKQVAPVDSQYLSFLASFGFIGLALYGIVLWRTFQAQPHDLTRFFTVFVFAVGIPFVIWEVFPANALLMMLWGTLLGIGGSMDTHVSYQGG